MSAPAAAASKVDSLDPMDEAEEEASSSSRGPLLLCSGGGEIFQVPFQVAIQSKLIRTMAVGDKEAADIPLPGIQSHVLKRVIEFFHYTAAHPDECKDIEKPLKSSNLAEVVSKWQADWIDALAQDELFEVILAANYLDASYLLQLACARIAAEMKGKTPEQIRTTFNIVNDFTPDEEAAVIAEPELMWAELVLLEKSLASDLRPLAIGAPVAARRKAGLLSLRALLGTQGWGLPETIQEVAEELATARDEDKAQNYKWGEDAMVRLGTIQMLLQAHQVGTQKKQKEKNEVALLPVVHLVHTFVNDQVRLDEVVMVTVPDMTRFMSLYDNHSIGAGKLLDACTVIMQLPMAHQKGVECPICL